MRKPVVKCLLSIVLVVVFLTTGFCVCANATAYPIYAYDDTQLIYNGGTSFSLYCPIIDNLDKLCCWYYRNYDGYTGYWQNVSEFTTGLQNPKLELYLRFGLTGFATNSQNNLTSGALPVGTVVRYELSLSAEIRSGGSGSFSTPSIRHYNGTNTTSWIFPDGISSESYYNTYQEFYFSNDFTIQTMPSNLGSEVKFSSQSLSGVTINVKNLVVSYTFPIEDADYCLENNIITQEQYNVIYNTLHPGGSGTDIAPWLQGDTNEYPTVTPDTLPPEVESYDTLFVPSDIDDSQIQSYLDRLDIGSWFRDFWAKMNSINIYLILIVIVLVLIFIRTLFMNFTNFIPK